MTTSTRTDHSSQIAQLRSTGTTECLAAAAILEVHDTTGLSLDNWWDVRDWVETLINGSIEENGA